jgi:hypothetical protein
VAVQITLANNRLVIGTDLALLALAPMLAPSSSEPSPRIQPGRVAVEVNRWAVVVANRIRTPARESQMPLKKAMVFNLAQLMRAPWG